MCENFQKVEYSSNITHRDITFHNITDTKIIHKSIFYKTKSIRSLLLPQNAVDETVLQTTSASVVKFLMRNFIDISLRVSRFIYIMSFLKTLSCAMFKKIVILVVDHQLFFNTV